MAAHPPGIHTDQESVLPVRAGEGGSGVPPRPRAQTRAGCQLQAVHERRPSTQQVTNLQQEGTSSMTDTPTETGQVRPFAAVLQDIDNGTLADQLGIDMQTLVNAVVELGRKGSLTIKFEVSRLKGNSGALSL